MFMLSQIPKAAVPKTKRKGKRVVFGRFPIFARQERITIHKCTTENGRDTEMQDRENTLEERPHPVKMEKEKK